MPRVPAMARRFLRETVRDAAVPTAVVLVVGVLLAAAGLALPAAWGRTLDLLLAGRHGEGAAWVALCAVLTAVTVSLGAVEGLLTAGGSARATARIRGICSMPGRRRASGSRTGIS